MLGLFQEVFVEGVFADGVFVAPEQPHFDIASVLGYWHAENGDDPVIGGDVQFVRGSPAWARDARGIWRRAGADTLRFAWRPLHGGWMKVAMIERARQNRSIVNTQFGNDFTLGWTKSGDAASTLAVVDDPAAVIAAGLGAIVPDGKVLKLDNSAGSTEARATNTQNTGGANNAIVITGGVYTVSAYVRGAGSFDLGPNPHGSGTAREATEQYLRWTETLTLANGDRFCIRAAPGTIVYFVLSQMEAGSYATSPIASPRGKADGSLVAAAITRDGDTVLFNDAPPDAGLPLLIYFSAVLGESFANLAGTKLWHMGGTNDPRAFVDITASGELRFVLRPGASAVYEARLPMDAAREDLLECAAWVIDGRLYLCAAVRGEAVAPGVVGDAFTPFDIGPWSAPQFWVGVGPTELDRSMLYPVTWKMLRADHLNPAYYESAIDVDDVLNQCRRIVIGPALTPLGTGEAE